MPRRLLVVLFRRSVLILVLVCLGCRAQTATPELNKRIERHLRASMNVPQNVSVAMATPRPSEFTGYEQVTITFSAGTRKITREFLLSKDGNTLIPLEKMDISKDPYADTMAKINVSGRPVRGNRAAKVTIVNYDDYQCPFCSRMHSTITDEIVKLYGDRVRIVYKDYPLYEIHPWANRAAVNANCLADQSEKGYWSYVDYLHANQKAISMTGAAPAGAPSPEMQWKRLDDLALEQGKLYGADMTKLQVCVTKQDDAKVRASVEEAEGLGVNSTPTLFVNGEKVAGAIPLNDLRAMIDRALVDAGQQPPAAPPAAPSSK